MIGSSVTLPLALRHDGRGLGLVVHTRPIATGLLFLSLMMLFLLSPPMLAMIGIPYAETGGSALTKIHPATYTCVLALGFWVMADGGVGPFLARSWRESPGALAFLAGIILLLYQVVGVQKTPISQVADNFILTFAMFSGLIRLDERSRVNMIWALHFVFLMNSLLGYMEVMTPFRVTPLYVNGELASWEWRATSIFGHPLVNAMQTSVYIMILAMGFGPFPTILRGILILIHCVALVFFGGRTGTVLTILALCGIGGLQFVRILLGRRFNITMAAGAIAAVTILVIAAILAVDHGMFDRFLSRFSDDAGSAHTRVAMLSIFRSMPLSEVLIAPNPVTIHDTQLKLDLAIAIESAVIGFIAYYGGIVTFFFFLGLGCYFSEFIRRFGLPCMLPLGAYLVMASAATSFATKSTELAMLTADFLLFFAQPLYRQSRSRSAPC